jgi:hypothetical protein
MTTMDLDTKVIATRASQGLPPTVQDPATLDHIATIFRLASPPDEPPEVTRKRRHKPEMQRRSETARTVVVR